MESLTDKTYFPPLGECLTGKTDILSWKLVASALADTSRDQITSATVSAFLKDAYVHQLIKDPTKAFPPPTAQSKSDFETKTAAINVVSTPNDQFDIKVIKQDALWLSSKAKVDEVAALRIVAVESQSRAESHLTGPLSTQDVANIQEAAGVSDAQASSILALLNVSAVADAETTWAEFEKESSRRQRILATYLSERRSFLSAADSLITFLLYSFSGSLGPEADTLRRTVFKDAFGWDELDPVSSMNLGYIEILVPKYISFLHDCMERSQMLPEGVDPQVMNEQLEIDWIRTSLTEAIHIMSVTFQFLDLFGDSFTSPDIVSEWFRFVSTFEFIEPSVGNNELVAELIVPLKSLVCVISLKLLNVKRALPYLSQDIDLSDIEEPYLATSAYLALIHGIVTTAADTGIITAGPVILAWSLILYRMYLAYQDRAERRDLAQNQRAQDGFELDYQPSVSGGRRNSAGSIVSIEKSPYDIFLSSHALERDVQPIETLAIAVTTGGQVYDTISEMSMCLGTGPLAAFKPIVGARMRQVFLDLLEQSFTLVGYQSEPVSCLLSTLSAGRQYWDLASEGSLKTTWKINPTLNENLLNSYLGQSLNRYPYEFLPFASLCRVLSSCLSSDSDNSRLMHDLLFNTKTLTMDWSENWNSYELVYEEENTNSFQLNQDVDLFSSSLSSKRRPGEEERFTIKAGVLGRFVTDVGRVALLEYSHSALALLGKRLEANLMADTYTTTFGFLTTDEMAETISLLATFLRVEVSKVSSHTSKGTSGSEAGLGILTETGRALPRSKDIITVITDILDGLIQMDLSSLDGPKISAMTSCLQFLDATLPICPGRIWAYMSRCGLVNGEAQAGRLSRITGNLDMFTERFDFLASAVKFFSGLVDNAMTSPVQRRMETTANGRSKGDENPWLGTSDKILSRVLLSVAQTTVDVFENSATWRFPSELDRSILVRDVVGTMNKLTSYTFSIGIPDSPSSLTNCLVPAAKYIVESFVSASSSSLRFQPLLATLLVAFQIPDSTLYPHRSRIVAERVNTVLVFATSLLQAANYLEQPSAGVQTQLFKSASLVARLPAVRQSFKTPSVSLLSALVESAGKGNGEPPSLLGYLGPQISRSFIQIASQLDRPFNRVPEVLATWKLFSTIMRNRQQWMANCLLTGKTPREALKGESKLSKLSPDSVLATALEKLRSISTIPSQEAIAVLDFFTSAQNYWPWTIFAMQQDTRFLHDLRAYVRELKAPSVVAKTDAREAGDQARIAAYIAETFAMQLYHLRQMGQGHKFAEVVVNDLDYLLRSGVQVSEYNASLHANFARNFGSRYPGCSVDDFKRTGLGPRELGSQYYYALDLAESMLRYDASWAGPRKNGFRHEMETANLNLSLVEAEVALFHAWEYLLLELSVSILPQNATIAKQMLQVAEQCLESNQMAQPPENIFIRLAHARANLALTLLQRLADSSHLPKDITNILTHISVTLNTVEEQFGKDQIAYFRTLLKILFVVLRGSRHSANSTAEKPPSDSPVPVTQLVLTILDRVVAQSFRTLVALVHESDSPTTPEDLALITAILQGCLSVPGIEQCQVQVLNIMSSYEILQVATSLFSWADKLAEKGDPIYGELSLLFLLELSALPTIAEQLACDGLLGHLTSANLAGFMRRSNVSPFADNAGAARCYNIWAKGILPLLLNILGALGATIAPEVAFVLNQFPNFLKSSVERFEAPGISRTASRDAPQFVTLIAISELHSLALLTRVLAALRVNNSRDIPEVSWDAGSVVENVDFWLSGRKILRERLLPLGSRENDWRAIKATAGSGCENRLEEKAVMQLEAVRDILSDE
ncbi:nucleoporin subcomplex protein binding to Pom34-domain-containing protein [Apodospora peruviana]|uniref:Nucleoporin NUP188 n=1 Tax=Apodospora peruviana TaxID=516989 RepID=A0AAE0HWD7_9PEZI|nr:nucleoporin subcomplex protein binding to Pom34-domain-containing protein [Apodospora peruviana]